MRGAALTGCFDEVRCYPEGDEGMKITLTRSGKQRQETWGRWFAWCPVFAETADDSPNGHIGLKFVWLEDVERREYIGYGGWTWRYREIV